MLDLASIPIVDQHAHNLLRPDVRFDYTAAFTEGYDPRVATRDVRETLSFKRGLREVATGLGCPPDLDAVLAERDRLGYDAVADRFLAASGIDTLLLDDGLWPDRIQPLGWHRRFARVFRLLRVEYLAEQLIGAAPTWTDFAARFRAALESVPDEVVGFKSIVAYRTGLDVAFTPDEDAASSAFVPLRRQVERGEPMRLAAKPLNDWIVRETLDQAACSGRPVQFHTGFGDPDLDLRLANPLHLRPAFENPAWRDARIVLLHASYPYAREAGYLAAVYPNAYTDLGLAIPFLSVAGMGATVRALLELTPLTKILFSTDAHLIPELFYLGARWGRRVLGTELERAVTDGDLTSAEAERGAELILRQNALDLYGLEEAAAFP
jgi:predicted TIM-barrel fold metal-dependent hydrolase